MNQSINPLIANRYSPRAYNGEPLSNEIIMSMFEAARWAASSRNSQPWRFIYAVKEQKERWNQLLECLTEPNQKWVSNAPFLMLALVQKADPETKAPRSHAEYQLGLAMGNFTLQASTLGVHLRNMGGFSAETAVRQFNIPDIYEPVVMVAAGYVVDGEITDKDFIVPTGKQRNRRPLDQLIFDGDWSKML